MIVDEKSARQKFCPTLTDINARCAASGCMGWRWFDPKNGNHHKGQDRRGYCGLAGEVKCQE